MAIRELDKIPTKALMARITAELEGLIVTDADGRYIYVNHRWSSLTGYTLDQVKGRYVRDIVRNSRVDEVLKSQKFAVTSRLEPNGFFSNGNQIIRV